MYLLYLTLPYSLPYYLTVPYYFTLPYLTLPYLTLPYLTLLYLTTLPYLTLPYYLPYFTPYLTLPYLTLPYLTLPYLTIPYYFTLPYLTLLYLTLPYLTTLPTLPYLTLLYLTFVIYFQIGRIVNRFSSDVVRFLHCVICSLKIFASGDEIFSLLNGFPYLALFYSFVTSTQAFFLFPALIPRADIDFDAVSTCSCSEC